MRFRWKLAILLLVISLLPIVTIRISGVKIVRHMADELIQQVRQSHIDNLRRQLRMVVGTYAAVVGRGRLQVEMALLLQAEAVEHALAGPAPDPGPVYFSQAINAGTDLPSSVMASPFHFNTGSDQQVHAVKVSFDHQMFTLSPGHDTQRARSDIARLATLTQMYAKINKRLHTMAFWHYTSLADGVHAGYPAHEGFPDDMVPVEQPWYKAAFINPVPWTDPYVDPATRQVVLAATQAVKGPDGEVAGVTSIVIPISVLLEQRALFNGLAPETASFMVYMDNDPDSGRSMPLIFARDEYTDVKYRSWRTQVDQEWLQSEDSAAYSEFLTDLSGGVSGARRMAYKGRDSLWVYGPTSSGSVLVLITPYSGILQPAQEAKARVQSIIDRLIDYTGYGIGIIIFVVLVLSLTFSQSVTRPLGALMDGVRALAGGDFNTRVQIDSADEFGDLGRLFNAVGPRLQEHGQMHHSLVLAKQVQQSLLPGADPRLPGLDIAGRCVFCDETGGDYYDYLIDDTHAPGALTIVVGDVSGHGMHTALLMATARAQLRQRASQGGTIADILGDVNQQLNVDVESSGQFMTMFYARIDAARRKVQWVRAGHEPGVICDPASGRFTELEGKGLPLGVFSETTYVQFENDIGPGQIFVLGTDGIHETVNEQGEMFGKAAFHEAILAHAHLPAEEILAAVVDVVARFRHPVEQKDDITLVVVKVLA